MSDHDQTSAKTTATPTLRDVFLHIFVDKDEATQRIAETLCEMDGHPPLALQSRNGSRPLRRAYEFYWEDAEALLS